MPNTREHHGGCCCGSVRYAVEGDTLWSAGCCCRDCARASGSPVIFWVGFSPDQIRFLKGEPLYIESSEGVLRGFCRTCGTSLTYGRGPGFDTANPILYVSAASLDEPNAFPPSEVVWYAQRPAWFSLSSKGMTLHDEVSPAHADRAYNNARRHQP